MSASKHLRVLSVRLPESELRRIKSVAATRGLSVQAAVQQALGAWTASVPKLPSEPLDALQGSLAEVDIEALMRKEKEVELAEDKRWL